MTIEIVFLVGLLAGGICSTIDHYYFNKEMKKLREEWENYYGHRN